MIKTIVWSLRSNIYKKYGRLSYKDNIPDCPKYYIKDKDRYISYWTNWWALFAYKFFCFLCWVCSIPHTIYSTYMCIRYPFLYPRHRLYGRHYNNRYLIDKHVELYKHQRFHWCEEENEPISKHKWYHKRVGNSVTWWDNWWALPLVNIVDFIHDYVLGFIFCVPSYSEYDMIPDAWRDAFGKKLINELKAELKKHNYLYQYRITDIKEKWGRLDWSDNGAPQSVRDIIKKYSDISYRTCSVCGKEARYRTEGYVLPYCEECCPKDQCVSDLRKYGKKYRLIGKIKFNEGIKVYEGVHELLKEKNPIDACLQRMDTSDIGDNTASYECLEYKYFQDFRCVVCYDGDNGLEVWGKLNPPSLQVFV